MFFVFCSCVALVKEKGTTYAVYAIHVTRTDPKGVTEIWDVYRRFSDFHDLHMCLTERFDTLSSMALPSKRPIRNTAKSFLDKRGKALTTYLQVWHKTSEGAVNDNAVIFLMFVAE